MRCKPAKEYNTRVLPSKNTPYLNGGESYSYTQASRSVFFHLFNSFDVNQRAISVSADSFESDP